MELERFITTLTKSRQLSLSWVRSIHKVCNYRYNITCNKQQTNKSLKQKNETEGLE